MFEKYIVMDLLLLGEFGKSFGVLGIWNGTFGILDSVIGYFHILSEILCRCICICICGICDKYQLMWSVSCFGPNSLTQLCIHSQANTSRRPQREVN